MGEQVLVALGQPLGLLGVGVELPAGGLVGGILGAQQLSCGVKTGGWSVLGQAEAQPLVELLGELFELFGAKPNG